MQAPCSISCTDPKCSEGCEFNDFSVDPVNCCPGLNSTLTEGNQIIYGVSPTLDESLCQTLPELEDLKLKGNELESITSNSNSGLECNSRQSYDHFISTDISSS